MMMYAPAHAQEGRFGEAGDIPGCILGESFDSQPTFSELPARDGKFFLYDLGDGGYIASSEGYGVVDNAAAISSPAYNGPVGGPDPTGERGGMLHLQRASLGEEPQDLGLVARRHTLYPDHWYFATPERPLFVTIDVYKGEHSAFQFVQHHGNFVYMNCFAGGHHLSGAFARLAQERGDPTLLEGLIFLGVRPLDIGEFYLAGKDIPEHSWYTVGMLLTVDEEGWGRRSFWVRDTETTGESGGPIARTPIRTSGEFAGQRMFSEFGLGLEEGWAQMYPGTEDDPATTDTIEGYGLATGGDETPLMPAPFEEDASGNRIGIFRLLPYYSYTRIFAGSDPTPQQVPGYEMTDWWVDNFCVRGGQRWPNFACQADFNVDGSVDASDLAEMLAAWGDPASLIYPSLYSIDLLDNSVSSSDLAALLASWGPCP